MQRAVAAARLFATGSCPAAGLPTHVTTYRGLGRRYKHLCASITIASSTEYQAGQAADEGEALAAASLLTSWLGLSIFRRRDNPGTICTHSFLVVRRSVITQGTTAA